MNEIQLTKGTLLQGVEIIDLGINNQGVAKYDKKVIFVDKAVTGDIVDLRILKKKKGVFLATVVNYSKLSEIRINQECIHFGICGGCKTRHLKYEAQVKLKEKIVRDNFERIGGFKDVRVNPAINAVETDFYRNKLEFTFSNQRWLTKEELKDGEKISDRNGVGFHVPGRFDRIVDIEKCWLQDDISNQIRNWVRSFCYDHDFSFFDPHKQTGFMRNMIIRNSPSGEVMVVMIFGHSKKADIDDLLKTLDTQFPQITSLYYMINEKKNDSIYDLDTVFYSGQPFISEKIGDIVLNIGPKSFYQTNSAQALTLYSQVLKYVEPKPGMHVYDLYCGVGSIGLYLSQYVGKVTGIETVDESVDQANINKSNNNIQNAVFYSGLVEELLTPEFIDENGSPDVVVVDPPRSGLHARVIRSLLEIKAGKIVYVSCNPATQARDIKMLSGFYQIIELQPVDMFPHTFHIENVALLKLID